MKGLVGWLIIIVAVLLVLGIITLSQLREFVFMVIGNFVEVFL